MVQKNLVYHKSAKGLEAIATRRHGLTPKLRSMLIMIDGKRTFDDLAKLSQALGDTGQVLGRLLDDGFIEPGAAAVVSAPAPIATGTAPPSATAHVSLTEAQRYVVKRLTDLMGPNAEELCLRIEATRNAHDLQVAVGRAEGLLRQYVPGHTVIEFMTEVQTHLTSA